MIVRIKKWDVYFCDCSTHNRLEGRDCG